MTTPTIRTRRTPPPGFGAALTAGRVASGLSGREVARRTGLPSGYYCQLEKGTRCPSVSVATLLADTLALDGELRAAVLGGAVADAGRDHPNRVRKQRNRDRRSASLGTQN